MRRAVGSLTDFSEKVVALHWNGSTWSPVATPALAGTLNAVSASSPGNIWAVGYGGSHPGSSLVLHWNGTSWSRQASPNPAGTGTAAENKLFGVSALSGTDVWAVGFYGHATAKFHVGKPLTLHWNGSTWTQVTAPFSGRFSGLDSVATLSHTNAWATGGVFHRGNLPTGAAIILHWNGTTWTRS